MVMASESFMQSGDGLAPAKIQTESPVGWSIIGEAFQDDAALNLYLMVQLLFGSETLHLSGESGAILVLVFLVTSLKAKLPSLTIYLLIG